MATEAKRARPADYSSEERQMEQSPSVATVFTPASPAPGFQTPKAGVFQNGPKNGLTSSFTVTPGMGSEPSLTRSFEKHARPLMDTIDEIRAMGLEGQDFQLPKIVVCGDQGVGKSSLLEALSGIQLPRGDGLVTRAPLELRLRNSRTDEAWHCHIRYPDKDGKIIDIDISSPSEVSQAIKDAQQVITGDANSISPTLISMEITSSNVPDLTLIDLPGIARYSEGNQNIEQQIKQLIRMHITSANTVIMTVFPGGTDVDTVAAIQLAKEVDPEKKRTMAVITKMDLVGPGSEDKVKEILQNKKLGFGLGVFGVKCRSQEEINRGIPLSEACEKEEAFFSFHQHFGRFNPRLLGVKNVSEKTVQELTSRIRNCLPDMNRIVSENINRLKKEIDELGKGPSEDDGERKREFLTLLTDYTDVLQQISKGEYKAEDNKWKLFSNWRTETEIFANEITNITNKGVKDSLTQDGEILDSLKKQRGKQLPHFVDSFPVCEKIITKLLEEWAVPANAYVCSVSGHVEFIFRDLASYRFDKFPNVGRRVKQIVDARLQEAIRHIEEDIKKLFEQESFVWTQDNTYTRELDGLQNDESRLKPTEQSTEIDLTSWNRYVQGVMDGVSAYMRVACRRVMDTIPQAVMYYALRVLPAEIKKYVLSVASQDSEIQALFKEREDIADRRKDMQDQLTRWRHAEKQLAAL